MRLFPVVCLLILPLLGCDQTLPPLDQQEDCTLPELAADFDPSSTATLVGRLAWSGEIPRVPPFYSSLTPRDFVCREFRYWPNPYAPQVDEESRGVGQVMVSLRGIDPRKSRPWDHPPVQVEIRSFQYQVLQGDRAGQSGIVRRGTSVTLVSRQEKFETIRARGSAFFSLPFVQRDQPQVRRLDRCGPVELSSGASRYWMRAHLHVDDHPYYTLTDEDGGFAFSQVPPGVYEVVCWLPSWISASHDRDADTAHICNMEFEPPVEVVAVVTVRPGEVGRVSLKVSREDFGKAK